MLVAEAISTAGGVRFEALDARPERLFQAHRARAVGLLQAVAHQGVEEERVAAGLGHHGLDVDGRAELRAGDAVVLVLLAGAEEQHRHQLLGLLLREAVQVDAAHQLRGEEGAEPAARLVGGGAHGGDEQELGRVRRAHQLGEEGEALVALAAKVPNAQGQLVDNPNRTWADIAPGLPAVKIPGLGVDTPADLETARRMLAKN